MHDQRFFTAEIEQDVLAASMNEIYLGIDQLFGKICWLDVRCEPLTAKLGGYDLPAPDERVQRP